MDILTQPGIPQFYTSWDNKHTAGWNRTTGSWWQKKPDWAYDSQYNFVRSSGQADSKNQPQYERMYFWHRRYI